MTEIGTLCLPDNTLYFRQSLLLCDVSNLFNHQTLSAAEQRFDCRPRRRAEDRVSRRMFWELAPEDVIGKPTDLSCANVECEGKRRKRKMEKASRRSWTENENSPKAMQLRDTLREFWKIFMDGPFGADAFFRHLSSPKLCSLTQ